MSFEVYNSFFLKDIDLSSYQDTYLIDVQKANECDRETLASLYSNFDVKKMFNRPSHFKRLISEPAGMIMNNLLDSDFINIVETLKPNSPIHPEDSKQSNSDKIDLSHFQHQELQVIPDTAKQEKLPLSIPNFNINVLKLKQEPTQVQLLDNSNSLVNIQMDCKLDGKFYLNSRFLSKISTDTIPIVCYRRNYINLEINLSLSNQPCWIIHNNFKYHINNLFIDLKCTSNFKGEEPEVLFFEPSKPSPTLQSNVDIPSNYHPRIQINGGDISDKSFLFKRFQFKKATPNNGKFIVKDYYYLNVKLIAELSLYETSIGSKRLQPFEIPIVNLISQPISVRGRNPSFYNNREDVPITKV